MEVILATFQQTGPASRTGKKEAAGIQNFLTELEEKQQ
jgi:hypothetical protein